MGLSTHQGLVTCMRALMGFMVGVRVVFVVAIVPVLGTCIPIISKSILVCMAMEPKKCISIILALRGTTVLLVTPVAVELSIWIGLFGLGQPMAVRV
jgi:hypothetical protein